MKKNEYKCAMCKNIYEKGWSDEECKSEYEENFGTLEEDVELVCDDCYKYMTRITTPKQYKEVMEAQTVQDLIYNS